MLVIVYLLTLTTIKRLAVALVTIELDEKLDYQFPIDALLKKWLPHDMLVFNNVECDNVMKCNPKGIHMYCPLFLIDEEALLSLSLLYRMWERDYEPS
jgi:hypothetical protein